jgi:glycerol-3-phosphate acyltransferase PlsY
MLAQLFAAGLGVILAYLVGSIPTGYLIARRKGVDIRTRGSHNIGATNVGRLLGRQAGVTTLLCDAAKGLFPVLMAKFLYAEPWTVALIGFASVSGHVWSVFLRFTGGKGVATGFGVLLGMAPVVAGGSVLVFLLIVALFRFVSLASIGASMAAPFLAWTSGFPRDCVVALFAIAAIILFRHRDNIRRIAAGRESKLQ